MDETFDRTNGSVKVTNSTNRTGTPDAEPSIQQTWWFLLIMALLIVLTVVANFLVVLTPITNKILRTPFNFLLVNIAFADVMVGLFDMPQYVAGYLYFGYWPYSDRQCTFWLLFDNLFVTLASMVVLSFDRLWAVTYPTRYRIYNTQRKAYVYIVLTWVYSCTAVLPGLTNARVYFANQAINKTCGWDMDGIPFWSSSSFSLVFTVWLPFVITSVCYVATVFKLRKARLNRLRSLPISVEPNPPMDRKLRRTGRERQAFYVLTFLVVSMFVSWGPWVVYTIRLNVLKYEDTLTFYYVAADLSYALSLVSPFMCFLGSRDMMSGLKRMVGWNRSGRQLEHPSNTKQTISNQRRVTPLGNST